MTRPLALLSLLLVCSAPAQAGRRADRLAERAWLTSSCDLGRIPADLRVLRGVLPTLAHPAASPDPTATDAPRVVVEWTMDRLYIDALPVREDAFAAALATAWARAMSSGPPEGQLVVLGASELPAERWRPLWEAVLTVRGSQRLIALEADSSSERPPPPAPDVEDRLRAGRAAIRQQVTDPFSRLSALEDLSVRVGVPRGDCAGVLAVLRDPLTEQATCANRVRDAIAALDGCGLRSVERRVAATTIGDRWAPSDRAVLRMIDVTGQPLPMAAVPFGVAVGSMLGPPIKDRVRP